MGRLKRLTENTGTKEQLLRDALEVGAFAGVIATLSAEAVLLIIWYVHKSF